MTNQDLYKISRALISVSNKEGLVELGDFLNQNGVEIISTGGSAKALVSSGLPVREVSDHTGFPEILNGRVKTLHPKIHGGILAQRSNANHLKTIAEHNITTIDLVVVNLYPFEEMVKIDAEFEVCIENIDVGGPTLIRAAAKNHESVTVVTDPDDYKLVIDSMVKNKGATTLELRRLLASRAYARTASYDATISNWFSKKTGEKFPRHYSISGIRNQIMRYGENPHQEAAFYRLEGGRKGGNTKKQIQGKSLSYNNLNDADAALQLVSEFQQPAVAIIKHANPCGVATGKTLADAYNRALLCDPVSAFGGIIAVNRTLNQSAAKLMSNLFIEVIVAPKISGGARVVLAQKKNLRIIQTNKILVPETPMFTMKLLTDGFLLQSQDLIQTQANDLKFVTQRKPTEQERFDLLFAFTVCKHVKSNAIVYAKNNATVGIGAGQMSRVDSCRIAAQKSADAAKAAGAPEPLAKGSVVASDAFFPFPDGLLTAVAAGATAVIQPGGSIRDNEVIQAADNNNIAMVFTGVRHFRH